MARVARMPLRPAIRQRSEGFGGAFVSCKWTLLALAWSSCQPPTSASRRPASGRGCTVLCHALSLAGSARLKLCRDERTRAPFYWAAFVPSGGWRPLPADGGEEHRP